MDKLLDKDEWIIVDSPIDDTYTNIQELNELISEIDKKDLMILSKTFLIGEIEEAVEDNSYTIIKLA